MRLKGYQIDYSKSWISIFSKMRIFYNSKRISLLKWIFQCVGWENNTAELLEQTTWDSCFTKMNHWKRLFLFWKIFYTEKSWMKLIMEALTHTPWHLLYTESSKKRNSSWPRVTKSRMNMLSRKRKTTCRGLSLTCILHFAR